MKYSWIMLLLAGLHACTGVKNNEIGMLPESLPTFEVLLDRGEVFDGYIFVRKTAEPGAQIMIDHSGKIVWFQLSDTALFRPFTPYQESYLALFSDTHIQELSYEGDTLLRVKMGIGGFDRPLHHEVIKDRSGNIVSLTKEEIPIDLSSSGGEQEDTIKTDGILRLSGSGEKLWHWKLTDVLDPLEDPDINRKKRDWGHANAIFEDIDGHYLVSWRDFNEIWKVHSESGEIIWRYGESTIADKNLLFYQQHGIHRSLDGEYLLFDNGHARARKTSRALGFNENLENTMIIELPDSLFSFKQGSVYQYERDRFLFSSTMTGMLIITNRKGDILWMAKGDQGGFYRAYYLDKSVLD